MLKLCNITSNPNGTLGLNLSRAPWDPYPWVSAVECGSNAYQAGVRAGDAVLELNGCDVLGQKISELASQIQNHWEEGRNYVTLLIWRSKTKNNAVNQDSLQKFAKCLKNITQLLECPVCLEVIKPPGRQCCNGHVTCNSCRGRTAKCPICRVSLGPRGRCLLADKLFTLLAESFPCEGAKNVNLLSKNYMNDCHETQLIKSKIGDSPPSTSSCSSTVSCPSSSSSIPTTTTKSSSSFQFFKKLYQRKQLTENTILNHLKKPNNNNDNNKLAADSKSTTPGDVEDDDEDVNIVVVKLNQKSRKKNDFVDEDEEQYASSGNLSSQHHDSHSQVHSHHHPQQQYQHHHQDLPKSHHRSALLGQQELTFHCPTGKSLCSSTRSDPDANTDATANADSEFDPHSKTKTLDCIWTQDITRCRHPRNLKGEEAKFETSGKFITKWDILFHLTQVHQISVAHHYTSFGQVVRVQLLQSSKSIPCITIQSERNWTQDRDKENLRQVYTMSSALCREKDKVQGHRYKTRSHPKNIDHQQASTELFFVACIPLEDVVVDIENNDDDVAMETDGNLKEEEGFHRNSMNDVHADPGGDIPPTYDDVVGNTAGPPSGFVSPPKGPCTGVIKTEMKSKSTSKGTHSQTTGHSIQDPGSSEDLTSTSTTSMQSRWLKQSPTNFHTRTGYRNSRSIRVDACTWCSFQSSCRFLPSPSSSSSSSSASSPSSSLASYSMSSSTSSHCCCTSPSDTVLSRQHAIFIWYFGNECDVKNFQTVIECKRTGLKWTGCVHPLTKSWSSLQRQQQQQRHMEQQFLVLNSMPDGGDNFFDIVIKIK